VVSFKPLPLYPQGKRPRYPLDRRLGGAQSRSGRHREVRISATTGLELRPLGRPARRQSLYRLRYPGSYNNNWLYIYLAKCIGHRGRIEAISIIHYLLSAKSVNWLVFTYWYLLNCSAQINYIINYCIYIYICYADGFPHRCIVTQHDAPLQHPYITFTAFKREFFNRKIKEKRNKQNEWNKNSNKKLINQNKRLTSQCWLTAFGHEPQSFQHSNGKKDPIPKRRA
jgi:hypothetical protein